MEFKVACWETMTSGRNAEMRNVFDLIPNTMELKLITRSHVEIIDVILSARISFAGTKTHRVCRKLMPLFVYYTLTRTIRGEN